MNIITRDTMQAEASYTINDNNSGIDIHKDSATVVTVASDSSYISHPDIDQIYKDMIHLTLNPTTSCSEHPRSPTSSTMPSPIPKMKGAKDTAARPSFKKTYRRRSIDNGGMVGIATPPDVNNCQWTHRIDEILNRDPSSPIKVKTKPPSPLSCSKQQLSSPGTPSRATWKHSRRHSMEGLPHPTFTRAGDDASLSQSQANQVKSAAQLSKRPKFVAPRSNCMDSDSTLVVESSTSPSKSTKVKNMEHSSPRSASDIAAAAALGNVNVRRQRRLSMEEQLSALKLNMLHANGDNVSRRAHHASMNKFAVPEAVKNHNRRISSATGTTTSSIASSSSEEDSCMTEPPSPTPSLKAREKKLLKSNFTEVGSNQNLDSLDGPPKFKTRRRRASMSDCMADVDAKIGMPCLPFHIAGGQNDQSSCEAKNGRDSSNNEGEVDYSKWDAAMERYLKESSQQEEPQVSVPAAKKEPNDVNKEPSSSSGKPTSNKFSRHRQYQQQRRCSTGGNMNDFYLLKNASRYYNSSIGSTAASHESNASSKSTKSTDKSVPTGSPSSSRKCSSSTASHSSFAEYKKSPARSSNHQTFDSKNENIYIHTVNRNNYGLDDSVSSLEASMREEDCKAAKDSHMKIYRVGLGSKDYTSGSTGSFEKKSSSRQNDFKEYKVSSPTGVADSHCAGNVDVCQKKVNGVRNRPFGRRSSCSNSSKNGYGRLKVPALSISKEFKTPFPIKTNNKKGRKDQDLDAERKIYKDMKSVSNQQHQKKEHYQQQLHEEKKKLQRGVNSHKRRTRRATVDCGIAPSKISELKRERRLHHDATSTDNRTNDSSTSPLKQMLLDHEDFLANVEGRYSSDLAARAAAPLPFSTAKKAVKKDMRGWYEPRQSGSDASVEETYHC